MRFAVPLVIFFALVGLLGYGLYFVDVREVSSPLIDKPAPAFSLPTVWNPDKTISEQDLAKEPSIFNVWASWCVACRSEHPLLVKLSKTKSVPIYGLNYKDKRQDAQKWLRTLGDPYLASASDKNGRVGIDWGVYGVPETFVVDTNGIIRYKYIGPVTQEVLDREILPLIEKLRNEP